MTGTMAGQIVMEGFLKLRMSAFARSVLTRALAVGPAIAVLALAGEESTMALLVGTQVVLSLQLPFAIVPLLRFTGERGFMGCFANGLAMKAAGWAGASVVIAANAWLVFQVAMRLQGLALHLVLLGVALCVLLLAYVAFTPLRRHSVRAPSTLGQIDEGSSPVGLVRP